MPDTDPQRPSAGQWAYECTTGAGFASTPLPDLPLFRFEPPSIRSRDHGSFYMGYQLFHTVNNEADFYAFVGYDQSARDEGNDAEYFLWDRYRRDGARPSEFCLQNQIRLYLRNHSVLFGELYGAAFDAMLGQSCDMAGHSLDKRCVNCPM